MSASMTGVPSVAVPTGSLSKSKSMVPTREYATTSGGLAR